MPVFLSTDGKDSTPLSATLISTETSVTSGLRSKIALRGFIMDTALRYVLDLRRVPSLNHISETIFMH